MTRVRDTDTGTGSSPRASLISRGAWALADTRKKGGDEGRERARGGKEGKERGREGGRERGRE